MGLLQPSHKDSSMCGIWVNVEGESFCHSQLSPLKRRGPDEMGFWTDGRVNIGHTRLAVLGLDDRSIQPMANDRYVLAYNGEIYNFHEINARLAARGIHLKPANDSEVLLHAWAEFGVDILKDLNGFWAFVVYDKEAQKLSFCRDQFGIKPLYYWCDKESIYASSLLGSIIENSSRKPSLDYEALSEYVRYQFTFGDKTFVKEIKKVLPGHHVEIDLNTREITDTIYEDIHHCSDEVMPFYPGWEEEIRDLLYDAVMESAVSDTAITTFCSGGMDSSLITAILKPEIAYHCNYSDPDCNETFFAQEVVQNLSTRLFVVNARERFNLVEAVFDIVRDFDELTIGSVILPLDDLLAQVSKRYKVILNGTGGDEIFGGYVRYMLANGHCNQDNYRELYHKMSSLNQLWQRFEKCHHKGDTTIYSFYNDIVVDSFRNEFESYDEPDSMMRMLHFDRANFLPGLLNIDDKMCGRHGVEGRPPLLHQKFYRHVRRFKSDFIFGNDSLKDLLRTVGGRWLSRAVTHRKDKMGFTTPIGGFVNQNAHEIREQIMNSPFRDLYQLKRVNFTAKSKYSREVFGLLMLDAWLNTYMS